jgi:hypothetical protein
MPRLTHGQYPGNRSENPNADPEIELGPHAERRKP